MRAHEYYEELCALLPIGQLSADEYEQLMNHFRECANCRLATGDFSAILDEMPVSEDDIDENDLTTLQGDSYRERFIKRAESEGVPFTRAVMQSGTARRKRVGWFKPVLKPSLATAAVVSIALLSLQLYRLSTRPINIPALQVVQGARTVNSDHEFISQLETRLSVLQALTSERQRLIAKLSSDLASSQSESRTAKAQLSTASDHLAQLQKQVADTNTMLASAKTELERTRSDKDSMAANLVSQQFKINELRDEVKEKAAVAERERELSSIAKDVREMMGARNLHILDVSDVDGNGHSKKSFGRVFLVEGKSLIFYAFDLGDRGNPAKVSFQAWGQLEGRQGIAKNLGVFYVDDHSQKRWVLKVNDPGKLSSINSIFVTVEPLGGADRPTGKKLLYAYFGNRANHP